MNESFNGKFREECLSMQWFKNRIDAKILIEEFRRQFNEVRPHSSLGQLTQKRIPTVPHAGSRPELAAARARLLSATGQRYRQS
jgi:putative transposase